MTTKQPPAQKHFDSPEYVAQNLLIEYQSFLKEFPETSPEICSYRLQCFMVDTIKLERKKAQAALETELEIRKVLLRRIIELLETPVIQSGNTIKLTHESAELVLPKEKKLFVEGRYKKGFNEELDAIKKLNPHLKTRVEGE